MKKLIFLTTLLMSFVGCSDDFYDEIYDYDEELAEDLQNNSEWKKADSTKLGSLGCVIIEDFSTTNRTPEIDCPVIGELYESGDPLNQHALDVYTALTVYKKELDSLKTEDLSIIDSNNLLVLSASTLLLKIEFSYLLPPDAIVGIY